MFAHCSQIAETLTKMSEKSIQISSNKNAKKEGKGKAFPVYRLGNQLIVTLKWLSFGFGFGLAVAVALVLVYCELRFAITLPVPGWLLPLYQFKTTYCADFLQHFARVFGCGYPLFFSLSRCLQNCSNMPRNVTVYNCQTCSVILTLHTATTTTTATRAQTSMCAAAHRWGQNSFGCHLFFIFPSPFLPPLSLSLSRLHVFPMSDDAILRKKAELLQYHPFNPIATGYIYMVYILSILAWPFCDIW